MPHDPPRLPYAGPKTPSPRPVGEDSPAVMVKDMLLYLLLAAAQLCGILALVSLTHAARAMGWW